jgi:arginine decarboxylase-like protein
MGKCVPDGGRWGRRCTLKGFVRTNAVVYSIQEICDEAHVPHPIIVLESGRAITAPHSVLIVEALGAYRKDQGQYTSAPLSSLSIRLTEEDCS